MVSSLLAYQSQTCIHFSSPIRATYSAHHILLSLFALAISDANASSSCQHLLFALPQLPADGRTCIICTRNWYRRLFNFHKYGNPLYIGPHLDPLSELWEETHDTSHPFPLPPYCLPPFHTKFNFLEMLRFHSDTDACIFLPLMLLIAPSILHFFTLRP